ncbi:MAG TPA: PilC/PilY family type IV pilus protein [Steroidobacteraceae bacterium]|nr:PilC/PilY family type IV pilus protein [Steroidobacteraceae bacterium]
MKHKHFSARFAVIAGGCAVALSFGVAAQVSVQDDFTQANDTNSWKTFNGACLTAGDGTGSIPRCVGLPYYAGQTLYGGNSGTLPDTAGSGALRFTNGNNNGSNNFANGGNQAGSIISNFTFPTGAGLQVIFKTVTYRGNSGGNGGGGTVDGHNGADGISFFLMDGSLAPYDTGAFGGSLGYTCSNSNDDATVRLDGSVRMYDGLVGAYLGLGIDEFGNFLNPSDNTASGPGLQAGRIGLRGAGNISWGYLSTNYPSLYPSSLTAIATGAKRSDGVSAQMKSDEAVRNTCKTGYLWNYSNPAAPVKTSTAIMDYPAIPNASKVLTAFKIANESANKRGDAQPISYNLKITQDGLLSLSYSYNSGTYQPVISKQDIKASNGALPTSFRFGFAGSTGGSTNIHEIMCFQATPADLAATSVGVNAKQASKIASGTQAFLAYYYPSNWTGRLTANDLLYDSNTQSVSISTTSNWDAACYLTGIPSGQSCPSTLAVGPTSAQGSANRVMLTWSNNRGSAFKFNQLSSADQNTIDAGDATPFNSKRVNYLRGDRTNEINASGLGLFRARDSLLGDIVDSSPTWVGPPKSPYPTGWTDMINSSASLAENGSGAQTYSAYLTSAGTRLNVVYAGSNDGFLHGFRAGSFDSSNNYVNNSTTPNDGKEVLAYMPGAVLQTIHNATDSTLDFASSSYSHNFFIDATPDTDDLFYTKAWHTWLVGGLGPGGAAIYALDVTDPTQFSESNAQTLVTGEWTSATISCSNVSSCGTRMGNTYGTPVIRRLHNGLWAIIFGNGYGSSSGDAGIFIITIDSSGSIGNTYYLSTGVSGSNGIGHVSPADLDGDHITDYVYAGDLLGNVWRFDLTNTNPGSWAVTSGPLFTVPGGQPITTKLQLAIVPQTAGPPRLMVDFGAGRKFPPNATTDTKYLSTAQSLFGIWDWNMSAWNALSAAAGRFASLTAPQSIALSNLTVQTLSAPTTDTRDVTGNVICWAGSGACGSGNTQFGWTIALPGAAEQLVFNPLMYQDALIVNTTIPANNSPVSCATATDTGYTMAVAIDTGGVLPGFFKNYSDTNAAGAQTNGVGTPFVVSAAGQSFLLTQSLGNGSKRLFDCQGKTCDKGLNNTGTIGKRRTWIQRR